MKQLKLGWKGEELVLSYLLNYKPILGTRTALVPWKHFKMHNIYNPNNIIIDANELLIINISDVKIVK